MNTFLMHIEINEHAHNVPFKTALDEALQNGRIDCIKLFLCVNEQHIHRRDFFGKNILQASMHSVDTLEYC